jgi:3-oxoacyl-[acyl-carrier-protein] synthase-1
MRVVVTGIGLVSCLGTTLEQVSGALRAGTSGIVSDPERIAMGFRSPLTGAITGYDVRSYVSRKQAKSLAPAAELAVGAAFDAVRASGLKPEALHDPNVGVIVGNDSCALPVIEAVDSVRQEKTTRLIGSGSILQVMNSSVTMNLATLFGVRGASWTLSGACASGAHAIGQGFMLIRSGLQHTVLVGGAQEINWQSMASFDALGAFARDEGDPSTAVRPFARSRRGLVPSGGAAMLVLERLDRAVARGAPILGEVVSYAFSSDGAHLTVPNGEGAARAMRSALFVAQRSPSEIEYVNAHATSTPAGDLAEGKALLEVFGGRTPPVSSTKSMTGHECWMAGASEVAYSLLMMRDGFLAPNINLDALDPELAGMDVVATTRAVRPRLVLSNSFGFGGTNAAIVLQAYEGA